MTALSWLVSSRRSSSHQQQQSLQPQRNPKEKSAYSWFRIQLRNVWYTMAYIYIKGADQRASKFIRFWSKVTGYHWSIFADWISIADDEFIAYFDHLWHVCSILFTHNFRQKIIPLTATYQSSSSILLLTIHWDVCYTATPVKLQLLLLRLLSPEKAGDNTHCHWLVDPFGSQPFLRWGKMEFW